MGVIVSPDAGVCTAFAMTVSTGPGATALTRMFAAEFGRLLTGEMRQPCLAGAVGDTQRRGTHPRDRGDVDDGAAALVAHDRRYRLGHHEGTGQVDSNYALPFLQAHVQHRLEHGDAGIVDQRIDAAEPSLGCSTAT